AAALFARDRTGRGQEVRMSLFESGLWMLASDIQAAITTGYCHTPGGRRAAPNPLFNFYRTKDGPSLHLVILQPDRHWSAFCGAIGCEDLRDDPRFASAPVRFQHCRELIAILDRCSPPARSTSGPRCSTPPTATGGACRPSPN